jgi:hypothetical protein
VEWSGINRFAVAQDGDSWWVLVNAVMNLRVQLSAGNFLTS